MGKFIYYRVDADRNSALLRGFRVELIPTIVYLKPDGTEFERQGGIHQTAENQKNFMLRALRKAGPIPIAAKPKELSPTEKAAAEVSAKNELRAAMLKLDVGRNKEAISGLKQGVAKYPGTKAAGQAQEKLRELGLE